MTKTKGDLLALARDGKYDAIVHGCNCFVRMGAGIARQIKKEYLKAFMADERTTRGDFSKLGKYTTAKVEHGLFIIINAYTQYDFQGEDNVDYQAIKDVFSRINMNFPGKKIGIPKIGAGLAGGDWKRIEGIIDEATPDVNIELVEYDR